MKKPRESKEPRHVRLYHWLMATEAWRDLDPVARTLYVELASRYSGTDKQGFSNNGRIPLSLLEVASLLNISKQTAMRAFNRLQSHGFITLERRGSFNTKVRHSTEWRLTEFACNGQPPSKDFTRWKNAEDGSTSKPARVSRRNRTGFQMEQSPSVTMAYGSTSKPVADNHGSISTPLVVYQGEGVAVATTGLQANPPHGSRAASRSSGATDLTTLDKSREPIPASAELAASLARKFKAGAA